MSLYQIVLRDKDGNEAEQRQWVEMTETVTRSGHAYIRNAEPVVWPAHTLPAGEYPEFVLIAADGSRKVGQLQGGNVFDGDGLTLTDFFEDASVAGRVAEAFRARNEANWRDHVFTALVLLIGVVALLLIYVKEIR